MDEWNDDEPEQGCDEESDPEIHDRFDHKRRLQLTLTSEYNDTRSQSPPVQAKISPNPGVCSVYSILSKRGGVSERVPARARGKLEVPDISAEPQPDAGTDRHDNDIAGGKRGHAEAADEIGRSVDTGETLIDRV